MKVISFQLFAKDNAFKIDNYAGRITTRRSLDYEKVQTYVLNISVEVRTHLGSYAFCQAFKGRFDETGKLCLPKSVLVIGRAVESQPGSWSIF